MLQCFIILIHDCRDGSIKELVTVYNHELQEALDRLEFIQNNLKFNGEEFLTAVMTKGWC